MSEEVEFPGEQLDEHIHEAAEHGKEGWFRWAALLSALFAVLAAISGLKSSHAESDAMLEQIDASDQWAYYQAKGIKGNIAESTAMMLQQLGKVETPELATQLAKYRSEQEEIKTEATARVTESKQHLKQHEILSYAVTMFQVAIAMVAIAVLTKRRRFLLVSLVLGATGAVFLAQGLML